MNILIPHSWLLEHLETDATPTEIQKYLSLCGPSVERIYDREGEEVYDIEVTTNRVDCMSVRGIAREAAVILPQFGKKASLKDAKLSAVPGVNGSELPLPKIVGNSEICPRTLCVILAEAQRATTPEWMAKRLRQIDQNVHDAVIDITNYITHELGHPCHAFDYDAIMKLGGEIRVVLVEAGKSFTTLDGVKYTTKGGEIVFMNPAGEIIDLPGIKGTANSAINDQTKNVLFWLESIDPKRVRQASMGHAIRTVAAQLNEKKVDPHLALDVFQRGVQLFQELTGARVASSVVDEFPNPAKPKNVEASASEFSRYLGVELKPALITEIFEKLGCEVQAVEQNGQTHWTVTPPTYRPDLEISADLVEEVARIYGYHNLPSVVMDTRIPLQPPVDYRPDLEQRLKRFLAARGWYELYTYSLVSAELAEASGYPVAEHLKVQNPLTDDKVYLRRSLLPSLRDVVENNLERPLQVFECANVYHPVPNGIPANVQYVGFVSTHSYREVVGELQALLRQFFISDLQVEPLVEAPGFAQAGEVTVTGKNQQRVAIGQVGVLSNGWIGASLSLTQLYQIAGTHPTYQPLPKTSVIVEDMTFTLPAAASVGKLLTAIREASPLITQVELADVYERNHTFRVTYHDPSRHLESADLTSVRPAIVELVRSQVSGTLVGQLP